MARFNESGRREHDFRLNSRVEEWEALAAPGARPESIGTSREYAIEQVAMHTEFAGRKEMVREVKLTVEPSRYSLSIGRTSAGGVAGSRVGLGEIDIHQIIADKLEGVTEKVLLETGAQIQLSDGSFIEGNRYAYGREDEGPLGEKKFQQGYLDVSYDATRYAEYGDFSYSVKLKQGAISPDNSIGFLVRTKVFIDDVIVSSSAEEFLPIFGVVNERVGAFRGFKSLKPKERFHLPIPEQYAP